MANPFNYDSKTLEVLEWPALCEELSKRAKTALGQVLALQLNPGAFSREESVRRARASFEVSELKTESNLSLPLGDIPSLGSLFVRISRSASIMLTEFADLVRFQKAAQTLSHFLNKNAAKKRNLATCLRGLDLLEDWSQRHFPLLDAQGEMVDGASEDLRALRSLAKELHAKIQRRLDDFLTNPKMAEIMQDYYVTLRDGRYVIPIKTGFRGRVPGIVHDVSKTEETLFVEPQEIVEWNNQLKVTEKEIEVEIDRVLAAVVEATRSVVGALENNGNVLALADLISAADQLRGDWGGQACVPESGAEMGYVGLRHPLLSLNSSATGAVVANTVTWKNALILTGPNAGGKTVLLKSLGLAVLMARSGLPVPAASASIPENLNGIFADIGDDQSLEHHLSTFSGHLQALKNMLERSGPDDLVMIDEITTGTSPEEGQPLAQAIIEEFLNRGSRLVVTTHYGNLKQFAMIDERCRIASMLLDSSTRKPTYRLELDIPGESSALEIAEQMGILPSVLSRARALRGEISPDLTKAVDRLEEARKKFQNRELQVAEAEASVREREAKAQEKIMEYEAKQREGLSSEARTLLRSLAELREELSAKVRAASREDLSVGATSLFEKISEVGDKFRSVSERPAGAQVVGASLDPAEADVGLWVEVQGLGLGSILESPKDLSKGQKTIIRVLVGEMQMGVPLSKLSKASESSVKAARAQLAVRASSRDRRDTHVLKSETASKGQSSASSICDVRGKSVDEALRRVEKALNDIAHDESAIVTVIHGHGTEKVKLGIREYLSKDRPDLKFRSGSWPGEGGDGVTVVESEKS